MRTDLVTGALHGNDFAARSNSAAAQLISRTHAELDQVMERLPERVLFFQIMRDLDEVMRS